MENLKGELLCLKTQGIKPNYSELSRIYGMDRRTIKKYYLEDVGHKKSSGKTSRLDKYHNLIKEKLTVPGTNRKAIYQFIKTNIDTDIGSYSNFRKYVSKHYDSLVEKNQEVHVRFETALGKQLQFDWKGPITLKNRNNEEYVFYIFSSTLCASRLHVYIYSKFMTFESVARCLIETFQYINGVPKECLTDNMPSIVITTKKKFTNEFLSFAKDMGFAPKKCKRCSPETKGKDESCNRFVNWILPYEHEFETESELIEIIKKINQQVNLEVNQTTNMKPIILFEKEKEYLNPLPKQQIIDQYLNTMVPAKVSNGLLVYYKGSQYSVPKKYINQTVKLNENDNKLYIYYNKDLIATHDISNKKINYNEEHYIEGLASSMPNQSELAIEEMAKQNLELLNQLTK